jgi:O-antigen/teichoic acid export membrane protein
MNNYKRLGKNTLLVFIGNIGSKSISFLMLPFYTSWLSTKDYGITDMINIYTTFLLSIITGCLAESIFIFPNKKTLIKQRVYFTTGLFFVLLSFVFSLFLFLFLNKIFNYYSIENSFSKYIWWIFWIIVATFCQNYMQQFSRGINKIRIYAISGIILTTCIAVSAFLLVPVYGVKGFFLSQILSLFITAIYIYISTKSYTFFSLKSIEFKRGQQMLYYSIPLIPNGIMWLFVSAFNRPLIEHYEGLSSVGVFSVANKFPGIAIILFSVFLSSWQISVLEEFKKDNYEKFYNNVLRIIFFVLVLLSCLITVLSETIISIMTNQNFLSAANYLPILTFAVLFSSVSGFVGANFSAIKKSKYYFYSSLFGAIASIFLNWFLIPIFGLLGAAISVAISYFIMSVFRVIYSWKFVKILKPKVYLSMIIINIAFIVVESFVKDFNYIIYSFLFFMLFLVNKSLFSTFKEIVFRLKLNFKNK